MPFDKAAAAPATIIVVADPAVKKQIPPGLIYDLRRQGSVIYMAGSIEIDGSKHPFGLTTLYGNPYLIYFRESNGDPFGDRERFILTLVRADDAKNDPLFVGGESNDQPFRAYSRVVTAAGNK